MYLLYEGGRGVYNALTLGEQVEMTCAEFIDKRPRNRWVKLTQAELVYDRVLGKASFGKLVTEILIPVTPKGAPRGEKTSIFLVSDKTDGVELEADGDLSTTQIKHVKRLTERLNTSDFIEGIVCIGLEDNDAVRRKILKQMDNVTTDFVMIEAGEKPTIMGALGKFGYAALLMFLGGCSGLMADWLNKKTKLASTSQRE